MRNSFIALFVSLGFFGSAPIWAQEPISTTVCAVMADPSAFSGRLVKLRATLETGPEAATISDAAGGSCDGPWLEIAPKKDSPARLEDSDAELQRQNPVFLFEDGNMKQYDDAMDAVVYPRDEDSEFEGASGPPKYKVSATMTGRVDYTGEHGFGFGHMNGSRVRFVLSAVENVSTQEIAYDWAKFSRDPVHFPHGTIQGKLTEAGGKPIGLAWIGAIPATRKVPLDYPKELTENDGTYSLYVKPGKYLIVVNYDEPATDRVPLLTTYYPSAESEGDATPITVVDYDEIKGIDIQIHRVLKPRFFDVQVLGAEGKPAVGAYVFLTQKDREDIAGNCCGVIKVDSQGRAKLLAFEELDYLLWAKLGGYPNEQCAPVIGLDSTRTNAETIVARISLPQNACMQQEQDALHAAYYAHPRRAPLP
jgi:hypothetical protein